MLNAKLIINLALTFDLHSTIPIKPGRTILKTKTWTVNDAYRLYNLREWGLGYFNINRRGHVIATPTKSKKKGIDLTAVLKEIKKKKVATPVLIRFQDILRSRVIELNESFARAIKEFGYKGRYQGVFPIKVNQMREVVEEILDAGKKYDFGLECGSKSELFACLSLIEGSDSLMICNGYKDEDYIRIALIGTRIKKRVVVVVEKLSELVEIIRQAKSEGVRPIIGIRAKLDARGTGRWAASGGDSSKFGLSTPEIIEAVQILKDTGFLESFQLLHYHIGSQITDIHKIKAAVREASRIYAKLKKMGISIQFVDVGGGLGIDYDGSRSLFDSSMNYTLDEYVNEVVYSIKEICDEEGVEHPGIVSESGRSLVAHHSVLVIDIFSSRKRLHSRGVKLKGSEPNLIKELLYVKEELEKNGEAHYLEAYHDAIQRRDDVQNMFNLGFLSLEDKAKADTIFWDICHEIGQSVKHGRSELPEDLQGLLDNTTDQYLCNFSMFQSLLDYWSINHLFPIMPIHRLLERPTEKAVLVDITCDSDGKITQFIDREDVSEYLMLHELGNDEYYVGIFLLGAYQDIMGDLHNLFGRVNEVHVFYDEEEKSNYYVEEVLRGTTISEALSLVQYDENELVKSMKKNLDHGVKKGSIKPKEAVRLLDLYEDGLGRYTYLDFPSTRKPKRK